jgi:hypothetical protein
LDSSNPAAIQNENSVRLETYSLKRKIDRGRISNFFAPEQILPKKETKPVDLAAGRSTYW